MSMPTGMDFLQRIADDRRRSIEQLKLRVPGHERRARLGSAAPAGRLERALRRGSQTGALKLLCEVKRASPSQGVLKADVDPVVMAKLYETGGAAAVSLVTEPAHFQGDLDWVDAVRTEVSIPILLKDFTVDPYQLVDAAARGADAVLLLAALLSDVHLQRFISDARLLGLDSLVEVHDEAQLQRALRAGATLVGINNRDLRTFEVHRDTAVNLLPQVPWMVTAVAESGLSAPADLESLRQTRCDAVLIGEAFMTSPDPAATLANLQSAARGGSG